MSDFDREFLNFLFNFIVDELKAINRRARENMARIKNGSVLVHHFPLMEPARFIPLIDENYISQNRIDLIVIPPLEAHHNACSIS